MTKTRETRPAICGTTTPEDLLEEIATVRAENPIRENARFRAESVHLNGTRWDRRILRVAFHGGSPEFRQRVASVANRWSAFAGIQFQFITAANAEIRLSLAQNGVNRSEVGIRALGVPAGQPTMQLGRLAENAPSIDFDYFVLHEFGHALGLVHEHQSPNQHIDWERQRVLNDCALAFGWTPPIVEAEIFRPFAAVNVNATVFDRFSIMNYPVPPGWARNVVIPRASSISPADANFIAMLYP